MRAVLISGILLFLFFTSCQKSYKGFGDQHVIVFDKELMQFLPDDYKSSEANEKEIIRLASGRILLRKITLPDFQRTTKASVKITLASAGDRWDKSGSAFVLPKNSVKNLLSISNGKHEFPIYKSGENEFSGIAIGEDYLPTLELLRFMTPFGVGAYSDSVDFKHRKPVYIPKWETEVVWEQDVTPLISELEGEVYVGVWIDTWTKEGYKISMELDFDESELEFDGQKQTSVLPLLNTIAYMGPIGNSNLFYQNEVSVNFNIPANAVNPVLYYTTTGHGGHSGGDEFVKQQNIVKLDGNTVLDFIPWRDDCASFRRFNPSTGVWLIKDSAQYLDRKAGGYQVKEIEERLGSSDLSRSNWCPGSKVAPEMITLGNLTPGEHILSVSIPNAQAVDGDKYNHWLVSAWLVWENKQ